MLTSLGKPDAPGTPYTVRSGTEWIQVGWVPGFDGGYTDTQYVALWNTRDGGSKEIQMPCYNDNPCNITQLRHQTTYTVKVSENSENLHLQSPGLQFFEKWRVLWSSPQKEVKFSSYGWMDGPRLQLRLEFGSGNHTLPLRMSKLQNKLTRTHLRDATLKASPCTRQEHNSTQCFFF